MVRWTARSRRRPHLALLRLRMQQIARLSGGQTFNAQSADQLSSIYKRLGRQLGTVTRKRDIAAEFVIGALALVLVAGVAATRSSPRLP